MNNTSFEYHYFIKDHLGNVRLVLSETSRHEPQVVQASSYYPFGMLFQNEQVQAAQGTDANRYLYNGKEIQKMPGGWYDYGARFYDAQLGRWHVVDPMAEKYTTQSPFAYCANSPVNLVDFNGMTYGESNIENAGAQFEDDGYKDLYGNYKWFDSETENIIQKEGKIWLHVSDDKNIYELAEAGILDDTPEQSDPGEINKGIDNLTTFEMWLDSPSENVGEGIGKGVLDILYSIANSPTILLTGKTLGGTVANSKEKIDAFVDTAPALISFGLTSTKEVVNLSKISNKGFSRYNKFVEKVPGVTATEGLPAGMKWQQRAGHLFQTNKINQKSLKSLDKARNALNVGNTTKKELEK